MGPPITDHAVGSILASRQRCRFSAEAWRDHPGTRGLTTGPAHRLPESSGVSGVSSFPDLAVDSRNSTHRPSCGPRGPRTLPSGIASRTVAQRVVATVAPRLPGRRRGRPDIHNPGPRRIRESGVTYPDLAPSFGLTLPNLGPIIRNRFQVHRDHEV